MKRTFNLIVLVTLLALTFGAQGVTPAAAAFPLPSVPSGYQISILASAGTLTADGRTLDGIVADPLSGNVYVATVASVYSSDFKLYQITPGGVVTLIGTYPYAHLEVVKMMWGPDGMIYTASLSDYGVYKIDPVTGASSLFGQGPSFARYGIDFDSGGNLIMSAEPDWVFYRVNPSPTGPTFLGTTNPNPPDDNHGDSFGIQPNGNYVVYGDNCYSPNNNYAVDTAGHVDGADYSSLAWVGATDLQSIYAPGYTVCGYSNGAIDPVSGDVYSITAWFGLGITSIAFTPAAGGASTAFVTGAGNGLTDTSQQGIVDLTFGKATSGIVGCNSLFFVDRYQSTVYEVTPACDTTPPVVTVPANFSVPQSQPGGAVVTFSVSATDETSPANPTVTCDWNSGDTFPLGTTSVTCSATDDAGNTGYGYFDVTVTAVAGGNLLKKPYFDNAILFPTPWRLFGVPYPKYGSVVDCATYNMAPCSILFTAGNRSAMQQVNRSGVAGDTYSFGLSSAAVDGGGKYMVEIGLYNNFNRLVSRTTMNFTPGSHGWEDQMGYVTATGNYNKIIFRFYYQNAVGRAWFDDSFVFFVGP